MPEKSGFDPLTLPESNATLLPEPFHAEIQKRWNRRGRRSPETDQFWRQSHPHRSGRQVRAPPRAFAPG